MSFRWGAAGVVGLRFLMAPAPRPLGLIPLVLGLMPFLSYGETLHRSAPLPQIVTPVNSACVSSPFGPRILPNRPLAGTFHYGIDLPAPIGAPVTAVAPGEVIRIQRHGVGGLEILIQHKSFVAIYSHLGLVVPALAEGHKAVYGGEKIASVGRTGLTYGPHLYFGMIVNGQPVDPAPYLGVSPCGSDQRAGQEARIRPTRIFERYRSMRPRQEGESD